MNTQVTTKIVTNNNKKIRDPQKRQFFEETKNENNGKLIDTYHFYVGYHIIRIERYFIIRSCLVIIQCSGSDTMSLLLLKKLNNVILFRIAI